MSDLFTRSAPKPKPGQGNARFLADLALGVSDDTLRAKIKAGDYPELHKPSIKGWRAMVGRR